MGPPTGGMMEGLLVSNSPFLGDFLDPPLYVGVASTQDSVPGIKLLYKFTRRKDSCRTP